MNLDNYIVKAYPLYDGNEKLIKTLNVLYEYIEEQWNIWAIKINSKTLAELSNWKNGLYLMLHFVKEDNWKAAYVTMKKNNMNIETLSKCFWREPEKYKECVKLYNNTMKEFIEFIPK